VIKPQDLKPGQEQYIKFHSKIMRKSLYQYDYRDYNGKLYSGTGVTLADAKVKVLKERINDRCIKQPTKSN